MKRYYQPEKLKEKYEDERYLKKRYGPEIAEGMAMFLNAVDAATCAYDIKCLTRFQMEHKKGNLKDYYAVTLDKKKSKWRLMLQMIDEQDNVVRPDDNEVDFLKRIKKIRIGELSDHYDEY